MVCDCQCDSGGRATKCFATGLVTELSDGVWWKNRKHMFEESSVALLWQVKPLQHVCQRCISKNWLGTGFSRVNQLQVINPPLISAQQVVNWLLLLIHGYFVIWRFSVALFMGLLQCTLVIPGGNVCSYWYVSEGTVDHLSVHLFALNFLFACQISFDLFHSHCL